MNCMCGAELIHGGDHDCEDHDDWEMVSNLTCPECNMFVLAYTPKEDDDGSTGDPA